MQKEEELRSALEACGARAADLERALAEGGRREEELRNVVRATRSAAAAGGGRVGGWATVVGGDEGRSRLDGGCV